MRFPFVIVTAGALALVAGCQSAPRAASSSSSSSVSSETPGQSKGLMESSPAPVAAGALADRPVATMWIHGMACPQCSYNVDLQLKKVPGVESVKVDMFTGRVQAFLSPTNPPSREQLTKAVENTTFTLVKLDMPGETVKQ